MGRKEKCIPNTNNQPCTREKEKKWWWEYGRETLANLGPGDALASQCNTGPTREMRGGGRTIMGGAIARRWQDLVDGDRRRLTLHAGKMNKEGAWLMKGERHLLQWHYFIITGLPHCISFFPHLTP
jgi:hypothetical protein